MDTDALHTLKHLYRACRMAALVMEQLRRCCLRYIMRTIFTLLICSIMAVRAGAQRNEIYDDRIASLQVVAGDDWLSLPVVRLGGSSPRDVINISFDDLTHTYRRYTYRIEHCEADWTTSQALFPADYIAGFYDGNTIDDVEESINTNTLYTHYRLQIPNERCRLTMSGNYKLTVYDENEGDVPVFTACFMVAEQRAAIRLGVTTNTDIGVNRHHQQVEMQADWHGISVTNPAEQIKTVVMQNGRWDDARRNAAPQHVMANGLRWTHCRDYIFEAGNEHRKYETLDPSHPTMGIDRIVWDGTNYHAYPFVDEPRPNYVYDEDADGAFYIRNSDNVENDRASEYLYVHYTLKCPRRNDGDVYIDAAWTNNSLAPQYRMEYDEEGQCYRAVVFQKQGYYSYRYLLAGPDGKARNMPTEGNFFQTENRYQALLYYRGTGERTDRLVGWQQVQIK